MSTCLFEHSLLLRNINCDEDYIEKTTRFCCRRMKEYEYYDNEYVCQYHHTAGHNLDFDNVNILDRDSNDLKFQLIEMMLIRKYIAGLKRLIN